VKTRNSCSGGAGGRPNSGAERFIGRADELRQVLGACVAAEEGPGSLIVVSGEAGIGKTRFCEEVMGRAQHGGLTIVYARCWVDGGASALWPWQQILAGLCGSDAVELLERDARRVAAERLSGCRALCSRVVR
jgi:predicted ATPase